ncbi:Tyrosine kinase-like (TKL) protein [Cryptosporidium felis]|nr:Tyrosine kinase-like (TKL) protein [Cryptosporidium felis]
MHYGVNKVVPAAVMPQNKCLNYCMISGVQSNTFNFRPNTENSQYLPFTSFTNDMDYFYKSQRPVILHKQITPPQTPNNIRYASISPFSRLNDLQLISGPESKFNKNYNIPIIMPSVSSRRDCINTPSISYKNLSGFHQNNVVFSQSPSHNQLVAPKTPSKKGTKFVYNHSNPSLSNEIKKMVTPFHQNYKSEKNSYHDNKFQSQAYNPSLHFRGPVTEIDASSMGDCALTKNKQNNQNSKGEDLKQKKKDIVSRDYSFETFSQVISNNGIIEIKKDLIKRVPDASNGVLQRLKPSEYIKMEDLILEPATQRGSFGVVFKGRIKSGVWKNREVAVKRWSFDNESRISEEHFKSLEREVYAYRLLHHPNICSYIGVCLEPGFYAIVTEYLPNGNLFELLYENKVMVSASDRLRISKQLCDAVYFIHRNNMIHRDIKTANIILDSFNNVKLCDFGQTRTMNSSANSDPPSVVLDENGGSPRYMAPECFYVGKPINEKSDVWAIACCLLEIFGAPIPFFDYSSNDEVINAIIVEKQKPKIPSWFHPSIFEILSRCFERKPSKRPSSYEILCILNSVHSEEIESYGMNTKRNIHGDQVNGNAGIHGGKNSNEKRIVGNCVGVAQQKRIIVRAPNCP